MLTLTRSGASAFASGSSTGSTSSPTAATCTTSVAICAALAGSTAPSTPESTENAITPAALTRFNTLSSAGSPDSSFAARVVARTPLLEAFERFFAETYRRKDVVSLRSSVAVPKINYASDRPPHADIHASARSRASTRASIVTTAHPLPRAILTNTSRARRTARSMRDHPAHSIHRNQTINQSPDRWLTRRRVAFARSLARSRTFTFANAPRRALCDITPLEACDIVCRDTIAIDRSIDRTIERARERFGARAVTLCVVYEVDHRI